jgi:hypothetical protein
MNRRKLSHVIAAGILAALLMLPGPVMARAPRTRAAAGTWQSLGKAWHELEALLLRGGMLQKEGYGIDPNGSKPPGSSGTTPSTSSAGAGEGTARPGQ